jgi:hypothetical protein
VSEPPRKPKLSRKIKIAIWAAGLVLAYTVAGFFVVPAIIKWQMLKRLPDLTWRQAAVREVTFNPYTFDFVMRGLSLTESNGSAFAGVDEFHLQFQALSSLSRRAWVFREVSITHPFAHVIRRKDGSFNFDNLLPTNATAAAAPARPIALPAVVIESLHIDGASLEADDLTTPVAFHDKFAPVNLQLTNFITKPNAASAFFFSAETDANEKLSATGQITLQPLQFSGSIKVAGVDLKRHGPYLAAFTTAQLTGGKLDVGVDYQAAVGPKGFDASVSNGTVQLTGLQVRAPDSAETVLSIPLLSVNLAEASLSNKEAHVSSVKSSGGSLLVRQSRDGNINLLGLMKKAAPAPAPVPPSAPWTARVDEIALDGYAVSVEDQKPGRPVKLDVSALAFTIKGFNSASNAPLATALSMRLNGQGKLSLNGTVGLAPLSGDLNLELAELDLPPFAAYLPSQFRLVFSKGQLNVKGRAQYTITPGLPAGSFTGDVSLKDFAVADPVHDRNLVKFDDLALRGIAARYPPVKLQIEEIALAGFNANVVMDASRQINVLSVVSNGPSTTAGAPERREEPAAALPAIDVGALVIDKASFRYVDESIEPHATFDLQELSGTLKGLSTQSKGPATVKLQGYMDPFSPYSIAGSVDPLAKDVSLDLAVSFKNLDLTSMTPYMEKYGGYPLNKGKLVLELKYNVAHRKLAASNKVVIADLTLGPRNSSTNATQLPIKFGVAMLKDREGKIDLDIPVSGSLDNPDFKVGPVIWNKVHELLLKMAASPFTFLGKALGGGAGEELSSVDFAPGEAVLAPSEKAKLKKLAKALYERPALTLQIAGACAPPADSAVLARRHLQRRINKLRADEQAAAGQTVESVESIKLKPADYARLLQKLYERTFGPVNSNQAASAPSNAPPVAAAAHPVEKAPELVYVPSTRGSDEPAGNRPVKGGELLIRHEAAQRRPPMAAAPKLAVPIQPTPIAASAAPSAPDLAQMEQKLLAQIPVTEDELRELIQARAKAVQVALLESGQIPAERIFVLSPRPIHSGAPGETRANFSLQ